MYVRRRTPVLTYHRKIEIALEVACNLEQLHRFGVIHGDLKCPNVLIADNYSLLLCDFGSSICLEDPPIDDCGAWFVPYLEHKSCGSAP